MTEHRVAAGALVLAALFYGVTFPVVHDALRDVTPFAYVLGRFTLATLVLLPSAAAVARHGRVDRNALARAGVVAGVLLFGGYALQTVGLQHTTPSTSAFITGLYAVLTPVVEAAWHRRLPPFSVSAGLVVATAGLYLLTGATLELSRGELFTLAAAALFALHIVYIGSHTRRLHPVPFTTMQLAVIALCAIPPTAAEGTGRVTALAVFAVVFTGVACSALALPLQLWGQRHIGPSRAALILLMEPVFAGVAGYVNGERLGTLRLLGGAVILAGIAFAELGPGARRDDVVGVLDRAR